MSLTTRITSKMASKKTCDSSERSESHEKRESTKKGSEKEDDPGARSFECNICLDAASDPVISLCGHLFCWPCIHQWLETRPEQQICPVCKAGISRDKVIPLYGRDGEQKDLREKPIPPRPQGQRPEPESSGGIFDSGQFSNAFSSGGFQMSYGIGAFPFGFFATNLSLGDQGMTTRGSSHFFEEQTFSRVFLWVAFAFILWLMLY